MKSKKEEVNYEPKMTDLEMLEDGRADTHSAARKCSMAFEESDSLATARVMCVAYNSMARMINTKRRWIVITK